MEHKIKKLSTNRFKINGIVYKRINSKNSCKGCHFYSRGVCHIVPGPHCTKEGYGEIQFYHLIPNEL